MGDGFLSKIGDAVGRRPLQKLYWKWM